MTKDAGTPGKYEQALFHLNDASEQLALAWELVEKAGDFESPEKLFHEFRANVIYAGDFIDLYFYLSTSDGYVLSKRNEKTRSRLKEIDKFETRDDIKEKLSEVRGIPSTHVFLENILPEENPYGILVAIAKSPLRLTTYSYLGILNLFLYFIRLKVIERRAREFKAFQKAVAEKAIVMSENLALQETWTRRVYKLLGSLHELLEHERNQASCDTIMNLVNELKNDVEPLQNINRSTQSILRSFSYFRETKAVRRETILRCLFREVEASLRASTEPERVALLMEEKVFVDPEQVSEAVKLTHFILNTFSDNSQPPLRIVSHSCTKDRIRFRLGNDQIDRSWLDHIKEGKRFWQPTGSVVSGPILLAFGLARQLLLNSDSKIEIIDGSQETLLGFEFDLPRFMKEI